MPEATSETPAVQTVTPNVVPQSPVAEPPVTGEPADPQQKDDATKSDFKSDESKNAVLADLQKEREQRKALQAQLDEIAKSKLTDQERAETERDEAKAAAAAAKTEALRWKIAAKHGISDSDAELFLHGTDEESLTATAVRLAELAKLPGAPKPDPSVGPRGDAKPKNLSEAVSAHYA